MSTIKIFLKKSSYMVDVRATITTFITLKIVWIIAERRRSNYNDQPIRTKPWPYATPKERWEANRGVGKRNHVSASIPQLSIAKNSYGGKSGDHY